LSEEQYRAATALGGGYVAGWQLVLDRFRALAENQRP